MRILLLGANGQLGRSFIEDGRLAARGELFAASRDGRRYDGAAIETADLAEPDALPALLDRVRPELIVNTAAYTAVDRAEQEEALATRVNGEAVGVLGRWAAAHGALLVHYSTDYVFDGAASTPYPVDAPTAPLGAYGRSKLAGELALRDSGAAHFIFRTAWVYAPHGHNFLRTMLRLADEREQLRVVDDQIGTPTPARLIANATAIMLARMSVAGAFTDAAPWGTYHLTAGGQTSWHGFAAVLLQAAQRAGLIARLPRLQAIASSDYPTRARRPSYSVLDCSRIERTFALQLPPWQTALAAVIGELASAR